MMNFQKSAYTQFADAKCNFYRQQLATLNSQRPVGPLQPKLAEQAVAADGQSPANNESMDVKVNS
jgi:hypothetical protein